jgi:zinc protease
MLVKQFKRALALFTLGLLSATSALAQNAPALPAGVTRAASVEGITEYRLPNGLRVLLFPDQSKQTVTVNITYLVGSKYENYGETGMAHLLEHLMFKGSKNHPVISKELESRGAQYNGTTWYDRTNYYESLTSTEDNLKWALELEADRMVNADIAKKDLDSEMTVVRNEYEMGENSPPEVLLERIFSTAYLWHNYGKSTIGARSDIENVPIDRLQAFYRRYYQPDNAVLLVAGRFDEAKTLALINQNFAAIPKPTRVLPKIYTEEPTQDGERTVTLRRTGDVQVVAAGYHIPGGAHPDAAAARVVMQILADTPSGRLHKALVETKKASQVFNFPFIFGEPSLLLVGAVVRQEDSLDVARDTLLQVVENLAKNPVTKEEVERGKAQLLKQIELNLNSSDQVGVELSEWIGMGDWRLLFINRDRLRKLTPEEVQRVATNYLKQSNRTLGLFIPTPKPDRAEIPPTPDVLALVKDYKGDATIAAGEAFDPSPANIEARTTRSTTNGGVKLVLLPKKTRGNAVVAQLMLHFGDEKSLQNRATAAQMAGAMLMRGTAKHTRQQIQDEFDRLKARVGVAGEAAAATATIETTRENLPAVLKLVAEILREPAFPANEFEQLKQEQLAEIEQGLSDPQALGVNAYQRHLSPYPKGDPRYVPTLEESLAEVKAVTLDQAKKFYADFYGAQNGELAVVGDFDDKAIAKLAGDLFNGWQSKTPYARLVAKFNDVAAVNKVIETPDKTNAIFLAGMNLPLRDDDPDYPALMLGNWMLGGSGLSARLTARIRGKEGLSYGVGSDLQAGTFDKAGNFTVFAIYAPQNAAKLEAAFKEEMARALKDGFTPEEVAAGKSGLLQAREADRAQDPSLARRLATYAYLGRTMVWSADLEKKVAALTPEQIVAALRKHIDPAKFSIVKAGDFAKAAKGETK